MSNVTFIKGGLFTDERGEISFVNDFVLNPTKRFYIINNADTNIIRAWQGHKIERRWFYCIRGKFDFRLVKINDFDNPKTDLPVEKYILSDKEPGVIAVPKGYANGFRALEENSKILVFSDYKLNDNKNDEYRFSKNNWTNWNQ